MNLARMFPIGLALLASHAGVSAQLIDQQVDGKSRICVYRAGPIADQTRARRVGFGEACPAHYPAADDNLPAPPTARLVSNRVEDGRRVCAYEQRGRTWSFVVPLGRRCAMTVGMLDAGSVPARRARERLIGG